MIVGFPPGGAPDVVARLIAEHMKGYASSVIIDNRPGAGGRVALETLKGAAADGSVMAFTPVDQLALFPHIYTQLGYKPLEDFTPVTHCLRSSVPDHRRPACPGECDDHWRVSSEWCRR